MNKKQEEASRKGHGKKCRCQVANRSGRILFLAVLFALLWGSASAQTSDIELTGTNSWLFHTPDDGRTTLFLAPKAGTGWYWGAQTQFLNNGSVVFSGNLGIGVQSPTYARLAILANPDQDAIGMSDYPLLKWNNGADLHFGGYKVGQWKKLSFYTSGAERLTIDSNGSVGINTSNLDPAYMLSVNGRIRATEVKVYTGWADFVFAPEYRLRPLSEVENHIKEHGHLPEIPSAKEVEENGVDLGKTDALLLQKIEELTLYIIEQEKKIEAQQLKTTALEVRLKSLEKRK